MYRGSGSGKKEPCRNFMRGSCHYGDRCKFLHTTNNQQQQLPTNARTNNPFGFDQFAQQPKGGTPSAFASNPKQQQNQFKPFQNKWTRTPDFNTPNFAKQSNEQPQQPAPAAANHSCNNPEVCKQLIREDFQNERPLWRLTCYAHFKHLPCDIAGDISYEELRAAAYDDAKKGLSLSSVVERERSLLNSKLIEFENLLRNPFVISPNNITDRPNAFPGNTSALSATAPKDVPPPVSSFSQLGFSANPGANTSAVASVSGSFAQKNPFSTSNQAPGSFVSNNLNFGTRGPFGNQQPLQPQGNAFTFNTPSSFGNTLAASSTNSSQSANVASNQSFSFPSAHTATNNRVGQTYGENKEDFCGDMGIWLKEKWDPGEIPEEAPPPQLCL